MEWIHLERYNGQFHIGKIRLKLNQKLRRSTKLGNCLLIDAEQCNLSVSELEEIITGLPKNKVRVRYPWPLRTGDE